MILSCVGLSPAILLSWSSGDSVIGHSFVLHRSYLEERGKSEKDIIGHAIF